MHSFHRSDIPQIHRLSLKKLIEEILVFSHTPLLPIHFLRRTHFFNYSYNSIISIILASVPDLSHVCAHIMHEKLNIQKPCMQTGEAWSWDYHHIMKTLEILFSCTKSHMYVRQELDFSVIGFLIQKHVYRKVFPSKLC